MRMGDRTIQRASDSHDNHLHFIFCKRKLPRKTQRLLSMILKEISDFLVVMYMYRFSKCGWAIAQSSMRAGRLAQYMSDLTREHPNDAISHFLSNCYYQLSTALTDQTLKGDSLSVPTFRTLSTGVKNTERAHRQSVALAF